MGFSWAMNNNAMKITNFVIHGFFSMPLTDHEKQRQFSCCFHVYFMGLCYDLRVFMGYEN